MTRTRGTGEKGLAIMMTGLLLIPLMVFAAFGVDLASWYSRISYLQKSADAAALAGTVWMPNLTTATTTACASLRENGIAGAPSCGTGDFEVLVERGTTSSTAIRVTVTDPRADRVFSGVFTEGSQRLSRSAEAEYNLPIPLGSPLNYFGGDATKTIPPAPTQTWGVSWPNPFGSSRPPAVAQVGETQQAFNCRVGASTTQPFGRWTNATTYEASNHNSSNPCFYSVTRSNASGTTNVPPPDHTRRAPNSQPCRVRTDGNGATVGRWSGGTFSTSTTGSEAACVWNNSTSGSVPPASYYNGGSGVPPINRPCNVGFEQALGRWNGAPGNNYQSNQRFTGASTAGNRLCRWPALIVDTTPPPDPNPIAPDRNPGFWGQIHGPGADQQSGDAYSTRCETTTNCATPNNSLYVAPTDPNHGYWYVVKIPAGGSGPTVLRVFDAQLTPGNLNDGTGDSAIVSGASFTTSYRVYRQTNPLDFNARTPVNPGGANQSPGSCNWDIQQQAEFRLNWVDLCTVSAAAGDTYLINVRTTTIGGVSNSAGRNGYALEACRTSSCTTGVQPALYARERMVLYNNINAGDSTFYIAEVGPQYAGRTLVLELFDPGESSGTAWLYPRRPSAFGPGAVNAVPPIDCDVTSTRTNYPRASDLHTGGECSVRTADGGALYNGQWLTVKIAIPTDYTCTPGTNPVTTAGSCWWGMRYSFSGSGSPTDTTTWQARIEGNPVHLTQ